MIRLEDLTAAGSALAASTNNDAWGWEGAALPQHSSNNGKLVAYVDESLNNLVVDGSDAMERFREIARRYPLLVLSRFPKRFMELLGTISLTRIYLNAPLFQNVRAECVVAVAVGCLGSPLTASCVVSVILKILEAMEILRPSLRAHLQAFPAFCDFMFQLLDVIADHHATDFYPLIARIWDAILDALDADYVEASAQVFAADRVEVLRTIIAMYAAAHPDVAALEAIISARSQGSEPSLYDAFASMHTARDKQQQLVSASQQQTIERLIERLTTLRDQDDVAQLFVDGVVSWGEVDSALQCISQLCSRSRQQESRTVSVLLQCAPPLSKLLPVGSLTKSLMSALCQVLVALLRYNDEHASVVLQRYISSLHTLRPALKESAVAYVLDFLSLAEPAQRQAILQLLFDDSSDIARSKLLAYLKSTAFRASALAVAP